MLRSSSLMNPSKHIAHIPYRIVRIELDRSRAAIRAAFCQRVYKQLNNGISTRITIFIQAISWFNLCLLIKSIIVIISSNLPVKNRSKSQCKQSRTHKVTYFDRITTKQPTFILIEEKLVVIMKYEIVFDFHLLCIHRYKRS